MDIHINCLSECERRTRTTRMIAHTTYGMAANAIKNVTASNLERINPRNPTAIGNNKAHMKYVRCDISHLTKIRHPNGALFYTCGRLICFLTENYLYYQ